MRRPPDWSVCEAAWALVRGKPAGLGFGGISARCFSISRGGFAHLRPKAQRSAEFCRWVNVHHSSFFFLSCACKIYYVDLCFLLCKKRSQWNINKKPVRKLTSHPAIHHRGRKTQFGVIEARHANCFQSHFASYLLMPHGRDHRGTLG